MALADYAICTVAEAKTWIGGLSDSTYDTMLENLIGVVSAMIENHLGRRVVARLSGSPPAAATITEVWSGDGTPTYAVLNPPIISVTSCAIESETAIDTTSTDYFRKDSEAGIIFLADGRVFTKYLPLNCTLVYVGGWLLASVPRPIWQVCLDEVRRIFKARDNNSLPIQSVSAEGQSVVYVQEQGLSQDAKAKLAPYVVRRYA